MPPLGPLEISQYDPYHQMGTIITGSATPSGIPGGRAVRFGHMELSICSKLYRQEQNFCLQSLKHIDKDDDLSGSSRDKGSQRPLSKTKIHPAVESSAEQLYTDSLAKPEKKKGFFARHMTTIILVAIFMAGIALIGYPSFSDYWNSFHQSRAIMNYTETVANMDQEKFDALIKKAQDYNAELAKTGINWTMSDEQKEKYDSLLNFDGTGNMGYINIPKINVELPIYHGTSDSVLQTSIGHLEETSLPVGGESTHTVLSGHRGLPSAKLFTDLDQLSEGDTFTLNILNQTLTYEVDQIRIVEPTDLSDLQIVDGQDLCTLVTCTPYGINTHRLLVRGHRIANQNGEAQVIADALQIRPIYIMPFVAVPILLILIIAVLVFPKRRR